MSAFDGRADAFHSPPQFRLMTRCGHLVPNSCERCLLGKLAQLVDTRAPTINESHVLGELISERAGSNRFRSHSIVSIDNLRPAQMAPLFRHQP